MGLIRTPKTLLQIWGLWPSGTIISKTGRKLYLAYRMFLIGYSGMFNLLQAIECIRLILRGESSERIGQSFSFLLTLGLSLWEGVIYLKNRIPQMFFKIVNTELVLENTKDKDIQAAYKRIVKINRIINIWVICSPAFAVTIFTANSCVKLYQTGPDFWKFDNVSFMHEIYFPFEKKDHVFSQITINVFMVIQSAFMMMAIQSTFYGLIGWISIQFKALGINLIKIHETPKVQDTKLVLKGFIKQHQDLIRFVSELNEAIKYVLLMNFVLNSIRVATGVLRIVTERDFGPIIFDIVYLSMLLSEIFLLGYMCNEVKVQSLAIADAAYKTSWHLEDKDFNIMLKMVIMRAQKPLIMTIGPFSPMTTETIITTLRAAYSYAALMMDHKSP